MLQKILDWSEVWALFIPLAVLLVKPIQPFFSKPVIYYVLLAIILNICIDVIWQQRLLNLTLPTNNNNPIYNIHSIIRFLLFSWFFIKLDQPFLSALKKIVPIFFLLFVLINFFFLEDFFKESLGHRLLSVETGSLLMYCLLYYLYLINEEKSSFTRLPSFWIVTGLSIYVVINFPIYLFYEVLLKTDKDFTIDIWTVPNLSYIIFCIFIAKGFYASKQ